MIPKVRFFGVRKLLNHVITWVNNHEVQSRETMKFRIETENRLAMLEECLRGRTIKRLTPKTTLKEAIDQAQGGKPPVDRQGFA